MDDEAERRIRADVLALQKKSASGLPSPEFTERALRTLATAHAQSNPGGVFMNTLRIFKARPRFVAGLFGCALAAGVLLMPISYERTVGHVVTLHMAAKNLKPLELSALAKQTKKALHAQSVQVKMQSGANQDLTLIARLPQRSPREVQKLSAELLASFQQQHIDATLDVAARTERTSGRVYAMALDKLIHISVDTTGKTDSQVADEIRDQLESNGVHDPSVAFERHGDDSQMQITADVDGRHMEVKRQVNGGSHPVIDLELGGIDDTREPGMTDDQLRDKILAQLRARGIDATVTVTGDRIEIRVEHHRTP